MNMTATQFGRYDNVPYRYFGRAKKSRNQRDDDCLPLTFKSLVGQGGSHKSSTGTTMNAFQASPSTQILLNARTERTLLPRRLCFVDQQTAGPQDISLSTLERYVPDH